MPMGSRVLRLRSLLFNSPRSDLEFKLFIGSLVGRTLHM